MCVRLEVIARRELGIVVEVTEVFAPELLRCPAACSRSATSARVRVASTPYERFDIVLARGAAGDGAERRIVDADDARERRPIGVVRHAIATQRSPTPSSSAHAERAVRHCARRAGCRRANG